MSLTGYRLTGRDHGGSETLLANRPKIAVIDYPLKYFGLKTEKIQNITILSVPKVSSLLFSFR